MGAGTGSGRSTAGCTANTYGATSPPQTRTERPRTDTMFRLLAFRLGEKVQLSISRLPSSEAMERSFSSCTCVVVTAAAAAVSGEVLRDNCNQGTNNTIT